MMQQYLLGFRNLFGPAIPHGGATWRRACPLGVLLLTLTGVFSPGAGAAEPLFVQRATIARPDQAAIDKALQQVREHKVVKLKEDLRVPPFHKRVEPPIREGEAYCQGCHKPLPHTAKLKDRAFLNMHSRYIACETCHFRPEDASLTFRWLDYKAQKAADPKADRFRTGRNIDNAELIDGGFKIAPFFQGDPAIAMRGSAFAKQVLKDWEEGDELAKARLKARIHSPLKKEGPACGKCHTEDKPMLDLLALGADREQATAIQRHVIPQFFGRYQTDEERLKIIDILR